MRLSPALATVLAPIGGGVGCERLMLKRYPPRPGPATRQLRLPPLCRPAGWVALWRRMGNLSVLNRRAALLS